MKIIKKVTAGIMRAIPNADFRIQNHKTKPFLKDRANPNFYD